MIKKLDVTIVDSTIQRLELAMIDIDYRPDRPEAAVLAKLTNAQRTVRVTKLV